MGAYKEAAKMATDALMKMMKTADNETLAVVWEFNKGSIIANTSMPLMDDDLNPADVKTKLETFDLSSIPDLAEISQKKAQETPEMFYKASASSATSLLSYYHSFSCRIAVIHQVLQLYKREQFDHLFDHDILWRSHFI